MTHRLSYQRSYNNRWEGYAGLSNGFRQYYTIENEDYNKVYSFAVDAGIKYVLFAQPNNRQLRRFSPFLSAGYYLEYLHGLRETENQLYLSNGQYGLGFVSEFSPRLGLQSSVIITQKLQDDFNTFLQYRAGLYFKVGKSQSTPIANIEEIDNPVVEGVIEPEYLVNLRDSIDQVSQRFDSLNSSNLAKIKRLEQLNKVLKDSLSSNEKQSIQRYFVVVFSSKSLESINTFEKRIAKKNYKTVVLENQAAGDYRLAIPAGDDYSKAAVVLNQVRDLVTASAWLLYQ